MGEGWYYDFPHTHFDRYSPPDFYTRVKIICNLIGFSLRLKLMITIFSGGDCWSHSRYGDEEDENVRG